MKHIIYAKQLNSLFILKIITKEYPQMQSNISTNIDILLFILSLINPKNYPPKISPTPSNTIANKAF